MELKSRTERWLPMLQNGAKSWGLVTKPGRMGLLEIQQ
jgi:hypothetical protein